jgi:hypothetical protein
LGGIQVEKKQSFFSRGSGIIEVLGANHREQRRTEGENKTIAGGGGGEGRKRIDGKIFLL